MFIYCEECNAIYSEYSLVAERHDTQYVTIDLTTSEIHKNSDATIVNTYPADKDNKINEVYISGDFEPSNEIACKMTCKHKVHFINYEPKEHSAEDIIKLFSLFEGPILKWYTIIKHVIPLNTKTLEEIFEIRRLLGITYFVAGDNKL